MFPVSLEVTALVLKSAPRSSCRVPSLAAVGFKSCILSPTCRQRFRSVLKGCPSLRHRGVLGCRSLGQPRPQNQTGLSERSIWLCCRHVKQQQLLIASDVSEHQLAPCCTSAWLVPPRRAARPPPSCPAWHKGDSPGGDGAQRGLDAPGHRLVLLVRSEG